MGKDLKGKELGVGISQLKDGRYTARFTTKSGKRIQKYFKKLQECRAWIADAQFQDEHGNPLLYDSPTADAWFDYWINEVKGDSIKTSTKNGYKSRWYGSISPVIGNMELKDIKPIHCQKVLNLLNESHKISSIKLRRVLMWSVFECAVDNDIIQKNPLRSAKVTGGEETVPKEALTIEEQQLFLQEAWKSAYGNEFSFILQTGIRVGELIALRWSDVDFENKKLHITKSATEIKGQGVVIDVPKTKSGIREIPLTEEAIRILHRQREKNNQNKVIPMKYADYIFINSHGKLVAKANYNSGLYVICDRAGIRHFSMHVLRHTFATRCIENGMRPKTLQAILGHSKIEMTMNLYVHVTDDSKSEEMKLIEKNLKLA